MSLTLITFYTINNVSAEAIVFALNQFNSFIDSSFFLFLLITFLALWLFLNSLLLQISAVFSSITEC